MNEKQRFQKSVCFTTVRIKQGTDEIKISSKYIRNFWKLKFSDNKNLICDESKNDRMTTDWV